MYPSERLRIAIEESNLTYEKLGQLTGIAKSSIQRYATGNTKKIPIDAIEKLALHLNKSPIYLMGWSTPLSEQAVDTFNCTTIQSGAASENLILSEAERAVVLKYRSLDDRGKSAVENTLDYEYQAKPASDADNIPRIAGNNNTSESDMSIHLELTAFEEQNAEKLKNKRKTETVD